MILIQRHGRPAYAKAMAGPGVVKATAGQARRRGRRARLLPNDHKREVIAVR
jgi:hypothetical protein